MLFEDFLSPGQNVIRFWSPGRNGLLWLNKESGLAGPRGLIEADVEWDRECGLWAGGLQ